MSSTRQKIGAFFERIGRFVTTHRLATIIGSLAVTALFVIHVPTLHMDMSMEGFLHPNDPERVAYDDFRRQFGNDNIVILTFETDDPFSTTFMRKLKALHHDLEHNVPYLDEVKSLINARNTYGQSDELVVEDLMEGWPAEPRDMEEVRHHAMTSPLYRNMYLDAKGRHVTMVVRPVASPSQQSDDLLSAFDEPDMPSPDAAEAQFLTPEEVGEFVSAIRTVVDRHQGEDFPVIVAGWPSVEMALLKIMKHDSVVFLLISLGLCATLLLILFRRIVPVTLALITVLLSFFSTLGFMGWAGIAYKIPSQVLPAFLTVVGVGYSVHILAIFYRYIRQGLQRNDAIVSALGHSGLAVLLTSLTTAGGLLSFLTADNAPLSDLGVYAGVGVLLAFFYSVFFMPAVLALLPVRTPKKIRHNTGLDNFLASLGTFASRHAYGVLIATALITAAGIYGVTQASYSHFPTQWLPTDMPERVATEYVDAHMSGSRNLEIILDTHTRNGLHNPELLATLDTLERELEERYPQKGTGIFVGKTLTLSDVLKEIHQALNGNAAEAFVVPDNAALIPQELLLFENSGTDDLEDFVDTAYSKVRFTIKVPDMDCTSYDLFIQDVVALFKSHLGNDITIQPTGIVGITSHILATVKQTQIASLSIAVVVISLLMVVFMGDLKIGLLSMVPNILPILMGVGVMGLLDIPFNNATTMVATIALGIAVDDTIHFMHNFKNRYQKTGDVAASLDHVFRTTGRALLFTSLVLIGGFMSYTFATLSVYYVFGALLSFNVLMALAAEFLLGPALLTIVLKNRQPKATTETATKESPQCA
jgi:predicted RND superfamily exporter protein